jgi:hypothetical protein
VIPARLNVDLWNPWVGAKRFYAPRLCGQAVPGSACGVSDGIVIVKQAMREEAFFQIKPDTLDWVQLWGVCRQRDEGHVRRHGEAVRTMPACLIEDHRSVFVLGEGLCKAIQEHLHRIGIGIGQHQSKSVVRSRLNGSEDIGKGKALIAKPWRAFAALPPDMADAAFLTDARFVLKEQANALAFMRTLKFFEELRGSF